MYQRHGSKRARQTVRNALATLSGGAARSANFVRNYNEAKYQNAAKKIQEFRNRVKFRRWVKSKAIFYNTMRKTPEFSSTLRALRLKKANGGWKRKHVPKNRLQPWRRV